MAVDISRLPSRWANGYPDWEGKWHGVFVRGKFSNSPGDFCLGDRMVGWEFGCDSSYLSCLQGSYSGDFHGGPDFGYDLKAAIEWLQDANHKEVGAYLWGGDLPENQDD
jgi:hypothetical protein